MTFQEIVGKVKRIILQGEVEEILSEPTSVEQESK